MSVILSDIYRETKEKYGLKLLAGGAGLSAEVSWVYIAESYVGKGYLRGGELIITTGVLCRESPEWLYQFIEAMIQEHTCGLILNIGRYIWPAYITREILELCENHKYPLFTMPWETLLSDVTRDYYNRIFNDNQANQIITDAFLNLVHERESAKAQVSRLAEYGYPAAGCYQTVYIRYSFPEADSHNRRTTESHIRLVLSRQIRESGFRGHLCCAEGYALLIFLLNRSEEGTLKRTVAALPECMTAVASGQTGYLPEGTEQALSLWTEKLAGTLAAQFPENQVLVGTGSRQESLLLLSESFFHAQAAVSYAGFYYEKTGRRCAFFDELGFFRVLLLVPDRKTLRAYSDAVLKPFTDYDAVHHSDCTDTLREYLRQDGSVQAMAAALYCHRNTINKRLRFLREGLGCPLDDHRMKFEWEAAFEIQEFLRIFPGRD